MSQDILGINNYTNTAGTRNSMADLSVSNSILLTNEGVVSGLVVTQTSPASPAVNVSTGYALIDGGVHGRLVFKLNTAITGLAVPDTSADHHYLVALKIDITNATATIVVVEGSSTTDPNLTEAGSPDVYYLVIARIIHLSASGVDITTAEINQDGVTLTNNSTPEIVHRATGTTPNILNAEAKNNWVIGLDTYCDYVCTGTADYVQIQKASDDHAATGGLLQVKQGDYDVNQAYPNKITIASNFTFRGNGFATNLITNYLNTSYTSTLGTVAAADNVVIEGIRLSGNTDAIAGGLRSGHNISIDGSSRSNLSMDCRIFNNWSFAGSNNYRMQYVQRGIIDNNLAINAEHGYYLYRSYDIKLNNIFSQAVNYGSYTAFMQRGMFINQMQGVQVNNYTLKDSYAAGILIRAYDASESGQDANSPICSYIQINNVDISSTSTSQTMTGGIQFMSSNTAGVEDIAVSNSSIRVGRGSAVKFLRGYSSGAIPFKNVRLSNMTISQKAIGTATHYSALSAYAYEDVPGTTQEPIDYAVEDFKATACVIKGEYPALVKWYKKSEFVNCSFLVDYGSSNYDAATFQNCLDLSLIGCTFNARAAGSGQDITIASTVTGNLKVIGCTAVNGRISIDDSGCTTSVYAGNIGFGIYNGVGIKKASRTLSNAEVLALNSTYVMVVTGVASKYIYPLYALYFHNYATAAFVCGGDIRLHWKDNTGYPMLKLLTAGILDQTANKTGISDPITGLKIPQSGQGIAAYATGALTAGGGTLKIEVYYNEI